MKWFFKFVSLIILMSNCFIVIRGYNLAEDTIQEGLTKLNSTETESDTFRGYCESCKRVVTLFRYYLQKGISEERILSLGTSLCISMKLQTSEVCESGVHLFGSGTMEIAKKIEMTAAEVCYFVLGDFCAEKVESPLHQWHISFPSNPKPELKPVESPKENEHRLKVLHLSDTHYDPLYVEGSNANCLEPLCCRKNDEHSNGSTIAPSNAAGKWGAFKCDLPKPTLENLLDHISETHKDIDYIIWTGDVVPHDVWNQTNEDMMMIIEDHIEMLSEKLDGIPIFPSIGNHERAPANLFPSVEQDGTISEFYDDMDTLWSRWLPINTSNTLRQGGFYSTLARPGLRIISLNMNVCSNLNLWLLLNSTDPSNELQWLINELQSAENEKEKVHIIGHIPPGNMDCIKTWSHNYYEIIARYENTVTAQFFGHTHYDEFEVFYDPKNLSRAINVAYIGPSVTPFVNLNPAYRIYYVDGDRSDTTRSVVDHETWVMDLEEANRINQPIWRKSYSAKDAYSMTGLRPSDWSNFIENMKKNDDLFDLYFSSFVLGIFESEMRCVRETKSENGNYWRNSHLRPHCSSKCKKELLCQAKSGRSRDVLALCRDLMSKDDKIEVLPEISTDADENFDKNGQKSHRVHLISITIVIFRLLITFFET